MPSKVGEFCTQVHIILFLLKLLHYISHCNKNDGQQYLNMFGEYSGSVAAIRLAIELPSGVHGQIQIGLDSPNSKCARRLSGAELEDSVFVCRCLLRRALDLSIIHDCQSEAMSVLHLPTYCML